MDITPLVPYVLIGAVVVVIGVMFVRRSTVFQYQIGVQWTDGRFRKILKPGSYWRFVPRTRIQILEGRPRTVTVPGQEVLSADGVSLKVSLILRFRIVEPKGAVLNSEDFTEALYASAQVALREAVSGSQMDRLLEARSETGAAILERVRPQASDLGLELIDLSIKDIMFPGALKEVFSQTARAKQEGLAALERARGETAALRNLANGARLLKDNPGIFQLRLIQSIAEAKGGQLVINMPNLEEKDPPAPSKS